VGILDTWAIQRKSARVMLVIDVSGSMGDPAGSGRDTKLDLAKAAAARSLEQFKDEDEVGLRIFSTDVTSDPSVFFIDPVPVAPMAAAQRQQLASTIENLTPIRGTPLYDVTAGSYETMLEGFDAEKINAIVLLSDGVNDDGIPDDDATQLDELITELRSGTEGGAAEPVRIFPIAYGREADLATLRRIAEATNAAVYSSADPTTIDQVFTAVISNF
jgi:Ca-activated chloride channel homolog